VTGIKSQRATLTTKEEQYDNSNPNIIIVDYNEESEKMGPMTAYYFQVRLIPLCILPDMRVQTPLILREYCPDCAG